MAQRHLLILHYAHVAHTSQPHVLLAGAHCEPCGSLMCFLFPVKEKLWAQGCILAIRVVWGCSPLQGLTGDNHLLSHTTPACKTWKVKQMGCWRLHWLYRNGKSQTYSWIRLKPNKQTLLVPLRHKKCLNPESPRAEKMQRRICFFFFCTTLK